MNRGVSGLSSLTTHNPSCSSFCERKAIAEPSGDQRGVEAFQPEGSSGRETERLSGQSTYGTVRRCNGCVGVTTNGSAPTRASHNVLTFLSSSTAETV